MMIDIRLLHQGSVVFGVFSGVIRDGPLLDAYGAVTRHPELRATRDEILVVTPGTKLLISFSAYAQIADWASTSPPGHAVHVRTAVVGDHVELLTNAKIYESAVQQREQPAETVRYFDELSAALRWLERDDMLEELGALLPVAGPPAPGAKDAFDHVHYGDLHDILAYTPLVLFEGFMAQGEGFKVLYVSEASKKVLGFPAEELVTSIVPLKDRLSPEDRERLAHFLPEKQHQDEGRVLKIELPYRHPTEGAMWLQLAMTATPRSLEGRRIWSGYALDLTEKRQLELELQVAATHDPLTALLNRRELLARLAHELARTQRYGRTLSIVMLDIDHFKAINDQHGHLAGDRVLVRVADVLRRSVREPDQTGRYGGEEFLLVLPETSLSEAIALAERVRERLQDVDIAGPELSNRLSASFGITNVVPGDSNALERALARADQAMYEAKKAGRNCVRCIAV